MKRDERSPTRRGTRRVARAACSLLIQYGDFEPCGRRSTKLTHGGRARFFRARRASQPPLLALRPTRRRGTPLPNPPSDFGPRTSDFGPRTSDLGLRTSDLGLRTSDFGSRISDLGSRISALRLRVRSPVREVTRAFECSPPRREAGSFRSARRRAPRTPGCPKEHVGMRREPFVARFASCGGCKEKSSLARRRCADVDAWTCLRAGAPRGRQRLCLPRPNGIQWRARREELTFRHESGSSSICARSSAAE
jgi:hypothetical protein